MRFVELNPDGRVRYVLPVALAREYPILPPYAVAIPEEADISEGDVYDPDTNTFRKPTTSEIAVIARPVFDAQRNALFSQTTWVRERHADRVSLGIDDASNWTAWLNYWQALRDMPTQADFNPQTPAWPQQPE